MTSHVKYMKTKNIKTNYTMTKNFKLLPKFKKNFSDWKEKS